MVPVRRSVRFGGTYARMDLVRVETPSSGSYSYSAPGRPTMAHANHTSDRIHSP